jgi:DnaJ-class molecular chaperone
MTQPEKEPCPTCFGTGQLPVMQSPYPMRKLMPIFCRHCDGTGFRPKRRVAGFKSKMALVRRTRRP